MEETVRRAAQSEHPAGERRMKTQECRVLLTRTQEMDATRKARLPPAPRAARPSLGLAAPAGGGGLP